MSGFQIINYNPASNYAVAERKDGRQYDVEIYNGTVTNVAAVGKRKVSVSSHQIGIDIEDVVEDVVEDLLQFGTKPFFRYGGYGGEVRPLETV